MTSKLLLQSFISSQVSGEKINPFVLDLDFLGTWSPNNFFSQILFPIAKIHIRLFHTLTKSSHLISQLPKSIKENSPQFPKFTLFTHSCKNFTQLWFSQLPKSIKENSPQFPKFTFIHTLAKKKKPLNLIFSAAKSKKKKTASKGKKES
jgi:hypothetical protein